MSSDRVSCIPRNATEWKSEANPQELALPFNRGGLRLELRLSDPLSHLTCPPNFFTNYICIERALLSSPLNSTTLVDIV